MHHIIPEARKLTETEAQARAVPAVRAVYAEPPGQGRWAPLNHRMICEALSAAGVHVGSYDHRIIWWLAGWEPQVCAVIAGFIIRAATKEGRP